MGETVATTCPDCEGNGWVTDHESACYLAGECVGCGGVQAMCEPCWGTGRQEDIGSSGAQS